MLRVGLCLLHSEYDDLKPDHLKTVAEIMIYLSSRIEQFSIEGSDSFKALEILKNSTTLKHLILDKVDSKEENLEIIR